MRGHDGRGLRRLVVAAAAAVLLSVCHAATLYAGSSMLEEPAQYGVYYDQYAPAFYTGFAPRTLDPQRIHLHIGRGNQLRATVVLSDEVVADYARDLRERYRTYRALIDGGQLQLTQNRGFDAFERTVRGVDLDRLVAEEANLSADRVRERNLHLLEQLNPGRIFRVRMPVDELIRRWLTHVQPADHAHMDADRRLELVNLMLPTRLFVPELNADESTQLTALVQRSPENPKDDIAVAQLRPAFERLLETVAHGVYPIHDGVVQFVEFTGIYPVGTLNEFTTYHGQQIPEYPTTGRRALTTHQRTLTVDHVPTDDIYSYFPWIPYIHIGPRLHDAIHTLFWKMRINETTFLPAAWRSAQQNRDGEPYEYLWLLSRGPMSHGCTHLNAGHISELRQLLPAESNQLDQVDLFLNTSPRYDVFDIDGDFEPEVMGVRYFIAYSLKNNKPDRLRVRDERHAYYDWLYAGDLEFDAADRGVFRHIRDGHFVGRTAVDGDEYERIMLYEADYEPEKVQFYRYVDIPFARELRKVGVHHPFATGNGSLVSAR